MCKTNFNDPNVETEGWRYLAVKNRLALLREITSKYDGNLYCLKYLHSFRTENKLISGEKVCKNKHFCGIVMLSQKIKAL